MGGGGRGGERLRGKEGRKRQRLWWGEGITEMTGREREKGREMHKERERNCSCIFIRLILPEIDMKSFLGLVVLVI